MIPELDESKCDGCAACVAVCPTRCLEKLGAAVWLPRPLDCIGCGACVFVCAPAALRGTAVAIGNGVRISPEE